MICAKEGYTFDDLFLIPKLSSIPTRESIDISTTLALGLDFDVPIASANMKHVTDLGMATTMYLHGCMPVMHRFATHDQICDDFSIMLDTEFADTWKLRTHVAFSIGVHEDDAKLAKRMFDLGARLVCIDVAHGHHTLVRDQIRRVKDLDSGAIVIAGNVATAEGAIYLHEAGASVVKTGIGGGSCCSTRIQTGNGVPQLSALAEVYEASWIRKPYGNDERRFTIIADGGIKTPGDAVKALCFSDMVMLGNVLAATSDAPGTAVKINGKLYKEYAGSTSHNVTHREGVAGLVEYRGETEIVIDEFRQGITSGMSYQGAKTLSELRQDPRFVKVSHAGLAESRPHSISWAE